MTRIVFLDAGPLGLLTAPPRKQGQNASCAKWLASLLAMGARVIVPEIADYEVRRELIRLKKSKSLTRLDALAAATEYLPLSTSAMRRAAELWAQARQQGKPTAGDKAIDGDVILAAQCLSSGLSAMVVATTNVGHLSRFVPAEHWDKIGP